MSAADPAVRPFSLIVVGTSSGGVEALSTVLPALPPTLRVPVLVVIHLPRERPSLLVDIFAPKCRLPVREAQDKDPLLPGVVYFAPPDYHLLVDREQGRPQLALSADDLVNFSRPSIDVLFESAADLHGPGVIGLLLTGASHDGAAGLRAIREAGGYTVVQHPQSALAPAMALAALALTPVDQVLPLADIARFLETLPSTEDLP